MLFQKQSIVIILDVVVVVVVEVADECIAWLFLGLDGLFCGFSGLATGGILECDGLDDTDSDCLSHITNGEATERWEFLEGLNAQRLGWCEDDDSSISRLDGLGVVFNRFAGTTIDLFLDFGELASNVSGVAIQDWRVTVRDLSRVVEDNDLGGEVVSTTWWVALGVTGNIATTQFLDGDVLNVETNIVSGNGFEQSFVMHLDRLDFSGQIDWREDNNHT